MSSKTLDWWTLAEWLFSYHFQLATEDKCWLWNRGFNEMLLEFFGINKLTSKYLKSWPIPAHIATCRERQSQFWSPYTKLHNVLRQRSVTRIRKGDLLRTSFTVFLKTWMSVTTDLSAESNPFTSTESPFFNLPCLTVPITTAPRPVICTDDSIGIIKGAFWNKGQIKRTYSQRNLHSFWIG